MLFVWGDYCSLGDVNVDKYFIREMMVVEGLIIVEAKEVSWSLLL